MNKYTYGSIKFQEKYKLSYPYVIGSMYKGISSAELVIKASQSGLLAFYGSGGVRMNVIEDSIIQIKRKLTSDQIFGVNLIYNSDKPYIEEQIVDLLLKYEVHVVEASAYVFVTPALVRYKIKGLRQDEQGRIVSANHIIVKLSRPEVVENFVQPIPTELIQQLLREGQITTQEAQLAQSVLLVDEVTVEADSAGHTDGANACVLWPTILRQCKRLCKKYGFEDINVGMAGGIGTPETVACAFMLGADYVVTGSINQCTVEAGTSVMVKELLQTMNIQDTIYVPAGDMFEVGAKIQVLKKGVFFPSRANRLFELYKNCDSIDDISPAMKKQLEKKYFNKSIDEVFEEVKAHYGESSDVIKNMTPKSKMAMIFKWYYAQATRNAMMGNRSNITDSLVYCGPAMGAFNRFVEDTDLADWKKRNVDTIGILLMEEAKTYLDQWFASKI